MVTVVSVFAFLLFYKPVVVVRHFAGKHKAVQVPAPAPEESVEPAPAPWQFPERNREEVFETISTFFRKAKEGIASHSILTLKVAGSRNGTEIHFLTVNSMEWPFVRLELSKGFVVGSPEKVYLCNGLYDVVYIVKGFWPPEVPRGKLHTAGILVVPDDMGGLDLRSFNSTCDGNGFVFTPGGEFAGVCYWGKFIDGEELYLSIPKRCYPVYAKEGENGNLQGKNG